MENVDVLFLYNERETGVKEIVQALSDKGYKTFFWKRNVKVGDSIDAGELEHLEIARKVLVCLGSHGWGSNHLRLYQEAKEKGKEILPILIGPADQKSMGEADGLFIKQRYLDLSDLNSESLDELVKALGMPLTSPNNHRFDNFVNTLIDGNEEQRSSVLGKVLTLSDEDKKALANRLHTEIQKFSPGMEQNYASAIRDPKKISSVRSWMLSCLISADPEPAPNKELILKHLNHDYDPDQNVRFWIIAELFHYNVSYLSEAINAVSDVSHGLVSMLGESIRSSKDIRLIESHRKALVSNEFEDQWKVLRILRVIAIPELSDLVTDLLIDSGSERMAYDALYALTNPAMMESAFPVLIRKLGTAGMIDKIISIIAASDKKTLKNFAEILTHYPEDEIRNVLNGLISNAETKVVAKSLNKAWTLIRSGISIPRTSIAGFTSDRIDVKKDFIDIQQDVKILTSVMLSKDITPPLAIGLFGNWGSGKSYFMESMREECSDIKKKHEFIETSPYHTEIVQIEFNAWNYSDSNLWASLVNHIFEQLADHITPKITEKESINNFLKQIGDLEKEIVLVKKEEDEIRAEREKKESEREILEKDRFNKPVSIRELNFESFRAMLSEEEKTKLNKSLEEMGFPAANDAVVDLSKVLEDVKSTKGRIFGIVISMMKSTNRYLIIGFIVVIIIIIPVLCWWLKEEISSAISAISAVMIGFASTLTTFTIALKSALKRVQAGVNSIEMVKNRIELSLEQLRKQPSEEETVLTAEIEELKTRENTATTNIKTKIDLIDTKKSELADYRNLKSLATFVADRSVAKEYKDHLGLMSTIRKDFDLLLTKLTFDAGDGKNISRIVLYIDDLDRCPPEKVIEVLQAVHLLLSYELFVVVVGVDPIWLLKSLKRKFSLNENTLATSDEDFLGSSPEHFLEKIFQIPFNLKQMSDEGFSKLISNLMSSKEAINEDVIIPQQPSTSQNPVMQNDEIVTHSDNIPAAKINTEEGSGGSEEVVNIPNINQTREKSNFDVVEEALVIQPWEVEFASELHAFIQSPRAAKRFSNLYRLLKAGVEEQDLDNYEGTEEIPGDFQVPMILLAILVGNVLISPSQLYGIFKNQGFTRFEIDQAKGKLVLSNDQLKSLENIIAVATFPTNPALLKIWLPKVCRFSLTA